MFVGSVCLFGLSALYLEYKNMKDDVLLAAETNLSYYNLSGFWVILFHFCLLVVL